MLCEVTKFVLKILKKSNRPSIGLSRPRRTRFAKRMFQRLLGGRLMVPTGSMFSAIVRIVLPPANW